MSSDNMSLPSNIAKVMTWLKLAIMMYSKKNNGTYTEETFTPSGFNEFGWSVHIKKWYAEIFRNAMNAFCAMSREELDELKDLLDKHQKDVLVSALQKTFASICKEDVIEFGHRHL